MIPPKKIKRMAKILGKREGPGCPPSREGNWKVRIKMKIPKAVKIPPPIRSPLFMFSKVFS
jgi:hypothetical protein